jgi:hypothetical protein
VDVHVELALQNVLHQPSAEALGLDHLGVRGLEVLVVIVVANRAVKSLPRLHQVILHFLKNFFYKFDLLRGVETHYSLSEQLAVADFFVLLFFQNTLGVQLGRLEHVQHGLVQFLHLFSPVGYVGFFFAGDVLAENFELVFLSAAGLSYSGAHVHHYVVGWVFQTHEVVTLHKHLIALFLGLLWLDRNNWGFFGDLLLGQGLLGLDLYRGFGLGGLLVGSLGLFCGFDLGLFGIGRLFRLCLRLGLFCGGLFSDGLLLFSRLLSCI